MRWPSGSSAPLRPPHSLQAAITQIGGQPEIRKDTACVVPFGAGKKHTTLQQPPDATHAAAVAALKKLAKTEIANINDTPLFELLQAVAKKHDLSFTVMSEAFKAEGVPNILDAKPKAKIAKGATVETVLREVLKSVDADFTIDPSGTFITIVPKSAVPKK